MNFSAAFARKIYPISFFLVLVSAVLFWQFVPLRTKTAAVLEKPAELADYDIRLDEAARERIEKFLSDAGKTESLIAADRKKFARGEKNLRAVNAKLKIEYSADLRTPETIAPDIWEDADFITAPSAEKRTDVLRNFLKRNSELVGLEDAQIDVLKTVADYTNPDGNLSFVHFEQSINGIPVFRGEIKAGFSRKNEIIRIVNNLAPGISDESVSTDFGNAKQAISNAVKFIDGEPFANQITAEKFYFPVESGVARTAWRVLLETRSDAFYVIVDAQDGTLLWRKKLTESQTQSATYEVYGSQTSISKTGDSPSPYTPGCLAPTGCPQPAAIARQTFTLIGNEPPYNFNNNGWIPDGETRTIGNNAEAGIDRDGTNGIDPNGWAFGNPNRNFAYVYNPAPGIPTPGEEPLPGTQTYPPSAFQQGTITHAFYTVNRYHDELYRFGFTEQARNFQTDNFGRGGLGNDSISVEVQDSSGTNGANFLVAADGNRGRVQMFIWTGPTPDRDGGLDSQVLIHELTHGVSSRLHGNGSGLSTNMSRGMGEGWGDFYALALLSEPSDAALGTHAVGGYVTYQLGGMTSNYYHGIRRFPTAVMASVGPNGRPHNPLTFGHLNGNCDTTLGTTAVAVSSAFPRNPVVSTSSGVQACDQIHNAGEIWSVALWEVRQQLIERHGAVEGNRRVLQYVTDGMKLAPVGPTFLQERDAIIAAAFASDANDVLPIRRGFAIRGMGYYASIQNAGTGSNNAQVTESFETVGNVFVANGFAVSDTVGNNNGYPEPGEPVLLTVPLTNTSGATVTNVSVQIPGGSTANYGDIANGQTVTRQIAYTVPAGAPCGIEFPITININSSVGAHSETRTIITGFPFGGPPVTFTNSTPLTLPASGASTPYGTTLNVTGLTGANKRIKLELTGLNHTYPGDLDVLLVGPGGQKFIVMSDSVSSFATQTNANVRLSDNATALLPATGSTVNMSGDWKPTNHDTTTDNFPAPAPAAPYSSPAPGATATFASVFGTGVAGLNGTWTLYINDDTSGDFGTLAGWKLTFEAADYICCFCPRGRPVTSSPDNATTTPVCTCVPPRSRADFDGDSKTDVSVFRPAEGNWYLNQSAAGFAVVNWGLSIDKLAPGDFDGDNRTDFAIFRANADSSQPDFYVLRSSNFTYATYSWGLPGDIPVVEDYDNDTRSDIAIYRPSDHTFYVFTSFFGNVKTFSGIESGVPAAGDFDGDGSADFATYSVDGWYLSRSGNNFANVSFTRWGVPGDKPVHGDYDGDGKDDFAVFRPSDRTWYILKSSGGYDFVQFGLADDVLVPGDYDGDRKTDVAVYRNGVWYISRTTAGMMITQFGLSSDVPIATGYLP